ncbi:GNAT family N-acetyltransferase [Shimia sp. Alg240-R146]|uniref:GNAT family N-acetyltransferase n=1 Tax=Shimia sp. Alg240-R146 TaxID=2993449 RepID=UPI0022E03EB3|nr:GNAT family N-acetyltransferase [Shimia sp. Alg240-R146]
MTQITVRPGGEADLRQAKDLLNDIIAAGGTTAITNPLSREDLGDWLMADPDKAIWHIAEDSDGNLLGFQWIGPWGDLPPEACEIGTFVKSGRTGLGIGSKLFEATKPAARGMGYRWIDAEIRADNTGGLAYYQSRGFEQYKRKENITLDDGTIVAKCLKRYIL